jgi:hypothetical protein
LPSSPATGRARTEIHRISSPSCTRNSMSSDAARETADASAALAVGESFG